MTSKDELQGGGKKVLSRDGQIQISIPTKGHVSQGSQADFAEACTNLALLRAGIESERAIQQRRVRAFELEQRQANFSELCYGLEAELGVSVAGLAAVFAALPSDHVVSFSESGKTAYKKPQDALVEVLRQMASLSRSRR